MASPSKRAPRTAHHRQAPGFQRLVRTLAKRVRLLRQERGWTIEEAAERFDVQPAMVRRIETGASNPSLAVLVSVARALGLSASQLLEERK